MALPNTPASRSSFTGRPVERKRGLTPPILAALKTFTQPLSTSGKRTQSTSPFSGTSVFGSVTVKPTRSLAAQTLGRPSHQTSGQTQSQTHSSGLNQSQSQSQTSSKSQVQSQTHSNAPASSQTNSALLSHEATVKNAGLPARPSLAQRSLQQVERPATSPLDAQLDEHLSRMFRILEKSNFGQKDFSEVLGLMSQNFCLSPSESGHMQLSQDMKTALRSKLERSPEMLREVWSNMKNARAQLVAHAKNAASAYEAASDGKILPGTFSKLVEHTFNEIDTIGLQIHGKEE